MRTVADAQEIQLLSGGKFLYIIWYNCNFDTFFIGVCARNGGKADKNKYLFNEGRLIVGFLKQQQY